MAKSRKIKKVNNILMYIVLAAQIGIDSHRKNTEGLIVLAIAVTLIYIITKDFVKATLYGVIYTMIHNLIRRSYEAFGPYGGAQFVNPKNLSTCVQDHPSCREGATSNPNIQCCEPFEDAPKGCGCEGFKDYAMVGVERFKNYKKKRGKKREAFSSKKKIIEKLKNVKKDLSAFEGDDDVNEDYMDLGTTFMEAYKNLSPKQIESMTNDTKDLINTQKQLINTLSNLGPAISSGKKIMEQFKHYFKDEI